MGRIKKLDTEGMLGRVNKQKLDDCYWEDFLKADQCLVEIDRLIAECEVEGITSVGYTSYADKIRMLQEDCHLLKEYPQELVDELIPVDQDFYHNVINAVDALSAIRIDDIRVKNTFNVTITQHLNEEDYEVYNTYENEGLKTDLTIADFMGYYEKVVYKGENSFVEGFTDVIYSNDLKAGKDLQTIAKENEELLKALLHGSEFEMKKYQPLTELSSCLFSAETCGLYSIETAFLGYDTITKERLTDDEASVRAITGIMSFATLLMGWGQAGGVAEGVVIYMSMAAADSAQIATAYGCEQLGAPPLVTALISTTVGMGVGALAFKVGNTYAKPYDAGNSGVFDRINKEATLASEMDPEDATRYRQWWDDTNSGINNHHPGMSDEDLNLWRIADEKLGDEMAIARVDGDAIIELRQRWQIEGLYDTAWSNELVGEGYTIIDSSVGNTYISIDNLTAKDIPSVKNGEFNAFFNSLTVDELDKLWSQPEIREIIEARLRSPGGLHEWHLVSRTPQFKYWDISAEQIRELRTLTSEVEFVNPIGVHGGRGSTLAHNELLIIIDTSNDYDTFVRRLNNWANYRLKGGVEALPEGLQIK